MPKLSIITVNLNNADGLQKTMESVVSQTFTDYEYIVVDGGSTDGSVDLIKRYEDKITYWVSELDRGIYNAMNKGIRQANGEYCMFLNSGDSLVDANVLEKVFCLNLQEDIIYGNLYHTQQGKKKKIIFPDKWTLRTFLLTTIPHQASFIKRSLFAELSLYDENLKVVADWEFFVRAIIIHQKSYIHLSDCFSNFEIGGTSSDRDKNCREKIPILSKSPYLELLSEIVYELQKETETYERNIVEYMNLKKGKLGFLVKLLLKMERIICKTKKT